MENDDRSYANLLGMGRTALLAGNNQEAVDYFNRVLEINPRESEAWIGKGKAVGWLSTLGNIRLNETVVAFQNAIGAASEESQPAVIAEAVAELNKLASLIHGMSYDHAVEFASVDSTWGDHIGKQAILVDVLHQAHSWKPDDRETLSNIVAMSKMLIEGIAYRDRIRQNAPGLSNLSPQYEAVQKAQLDAAAEKLAVLDPGYSKPTIVKKEKEGCFVVTATMGDYDHPTVLLLRRFRDEWMRSGPVGRRTIRAYYRVGPGMAAVIGRKPVLRAISYRLLVQPSAWLATRIMRRRHSHTGSDR